MCSHSLFPYLVYFALSHSSLTLCHDLSCSMKKDDSERAVDVLSTGRPVTKYNSSGVLGNFREGRDSNPCLAWLGGSSLVTILPWKEEVPSFNSVFSKVGSGKEIKIIS